MLNTVYSFYIMIDSLKFSSPEAVSPVKPLAVDHITSRYLHSKKGADSGYNSTPGNHDGNGATVEARLAPNTLPIGTNSKEINTSIYTKFHFI